MRTMTFLSDDALSLSEKQEDHVFVIPPPCPIIDPISDWAWSRALPVI
jgi:hypothetical protein